MKARGSATKASGDDVTMAQDHIIFVYGTLKQGFYNHAIMEKIGFSYLGTGVTRNAYALCVGGKYNVPFLFEPKDTGSCTGEAHQIAGEVYRISSALLDELDVPHDRVPSSDLRDGEF